MPTLRVLDLFCGAGGAGMGYWRGFAEAGYDVEMVGVDVNPQPNYPFEFVQADAMTFPLDGFAFIHASPPCQTYSAMSHCRPGLSDEYPDLVAAIRDRLALSGTPYVIENVVGSPMTTAPDLFGSYGAVLCGHMFGLSLYRHRVFETSVPVVAPPHPPHLVPASKAGHWREGTIVSVSGNCAPIARSRSAMGIDWMSRSELAEAIPPAYTEYLAEQFAPVLAPALAGA